MKNATPKVNLATSSYHNRPKREAVLIVACSDGWIEVYGQKHVDVLLINKPHATTAEAGCLAEQGIDLKLPRRFREVFWPSMKRAADRLRKTTAADLIDLKHKAICFEAIDTLKQLGVQQ